MPLFALVAHDRRDAGTLRADTRPAHLAHLEAIRDRLLVAGPMIGAAGAPTGSIVIATFGDLAEAEAFAAGDPYARAGLFAEVTVTAYRKVLP